MARALLLKALIADRFNGNQSAFAEAIKRSPAQVNQWLNGHRKIGDAGARTIELAIGLPPGYFDRAVNYPTHTSTAHQISESNDDAPIAEVVSLMRAADHAGRLMALGAVRAALAGYAKGG